MFSPKAIPRDQVIWDVKHGIGKIKYVWNVLPDGHSIRNKNTVSQCLINVESMIRRDCVLNATMDTI